MSPTVTVQLHSRSGDSTKGSTFGRQHRSIIKNLRAHYNCPKSAHQKCCYTCVRALIIQYKCTKMSYVQTAHHFTGLEREKAQYLLDKTQLRIWEALSLHPYLPRHTTRQNRTPNLRGSSTKSILILAKTCQTGDLVLIGTVQMLMGFRTTR